MLIFISSSFLLQFLFFHNFTKKIQIANFFLRTIFLLFFSRVLQYFSNASHNITVKVLLVWGLRLYGSTPEGLDP